MRGSSSDRRALERDARDARARLCRRTASSRVPRVVTVREPCTRTAHSDPTLSSRVVGHSATRVDARSIRFARVDRTSSPTISRAARARARLARVLRRASRMRATRALGAVLIVALVASTGAHGAVSCATRSDAKLLSVELDSSGSKATVPGVLALFGGDVGGDAAGGPWTLGKPGAGEDEYGCQALQSSTKDVLIVKRGTCEFYQKAKVAQEAGVKAVFIVSGDDELTTMTCDNSDPLSIVTVLLAGSDGRALLEAADLTGVTATVSLAPMTTMKIDLVASTALVVLALSTIILGGMWSLKDRRNDFSVKREDEVNGLSDRGDGERQEGIEINEYTAFWFVIMASAVLLVLFYSMQHWIFVVMRGVFALASFQGLQVIFFEALMAQRRTASRDSKVALPLFGTVHFMAIPAAIMAGLVVATWLIFSKATWAWLLQDIMGLSFLINVLRLVHLPSLKVATILLSCAMMYDIFWVYVQPHLFGKKSVMVTVARGGDRGESLPMLFLFPRLAGGGDFSMLGYGDVILPGLLIVHNLLFDNRKRESEVKYFYFFWSLVAYVVGMCLTFTALYLEVGGQGGQPALTYLVPTVVGTTSYLAWQHHDLGEMWRGFDDDYVTLPSEVPTTL